MNTKPIISTLKTVSVDEMFFDAANDSCKVAKEHKEKILKMRDELHTREWYPYYVAYDNGDEVDIHAFDIPQKEFDKVSIFEFQMAKTSQIFIKSVVMIHIYCALSLESHINRQGKILLTPPEFNRFEQKSHKEKWKSLPKKIKNKSFDLRKSPFLDFVELIKLRNSIVHYKELPGMWNNGDSEWYNKNLEDSLNIAEKSISTTRAMIVRLSELLEQGYPPMLKEKRPISIV